MHSSIKFKNNFLGLIVVLFCSCKSTSKLQTASEIKVIQCPNLNSPSICTANSTVKIRSAPAGEQILRGDEEFLYAGQEFYFDSAVQAAPLNGEVYCWLRLNDGVQSFWAASNFFNCEVSHRSIIAPTPADSSQADSSQADTVESATACKGKNAIFYTGRCAHNCGIPSNDSTVLVPTIEHISNLWNDESLANLCPDISTVAGFSAGRVPLYKRMLKKDTLQQETLKIAILIDPSFNDEAQTSIGGYPKEILNNWLNLPSSKLYFIYNPSSAGWQDIVHAISNFPVEKVRYCTVNIEHTKIAQELQLDLVKNPDKYFAINGGPCVLETR